MHRCWNTRVTLFMLGTVSADPQFRGMESSACHLQEVAEPCPSVSLEEVLKSHNSVTASTPVELICSTQPEDCTKLSLISVLSCVENTDLCSASDAKDDGKLQQESLPDTGTPDNVCCTGTDLPDMPGAGMVGPDGFLVEETECTRQTAACSALLAESHHDTDESEYESEEELPGIQTRASVLASADGGSLDDDFKEFEREISCIERKVSEPHGTEQVDSAGQQEVLPINTGVACGIPLDTFSSDILDRAYGRLQSLAPQRMVDEMKMALEDVPEV